jgi:hypothetical protein
LGNAHNAGSRHVLELGSGLMADGSFAARQMRTCYKRAVL